MNQDVRKDEALIDAMWTPQIDDSPNDDFVTGFDAGWAAAMKQTEGDRA